MDNRLIFLYRGYAIDDAMTQKDSLSGAMVDPVQAKRLPCCEARTAQGWFVMGTEQK